VEGLVDGVEEGVDVLLEDTSLVIVDAGNVVLNDVGVGGAKEGEGIRFAKWFRINNVVAVGIVGSGADGVGTSDIGGGAGNFWEASRLGTAEPVGGKSLVAEDRTHGIGRELGGSPVGEELEDETDLRESGEDTSDVELELLIIFLVLVEPIELELLEGLVVDDRVVSTDGIAVTESPDVVQEGVVEVILEVDAVANEVVSAGRGDITLESTVQSNTTSNGAVNLARRGWDVRSGVSDGYLANEWVATSQSGEGDDESGEIVLDVETFHNTTMDLFNGGRTITGDVPMIGESVQGRARSTEIAGSGSPVGVSCVRDFLGASVARDGVEADDASNLTITGFWSIGSISHNAFELFRRHSGEREGGLNGSQDGCGSEELELHVVDRCSWFR